LQSGEKSGRTGSHNYHFLSIGNIFIFGKLFVFLIQFTKRNGAVQVVEDQLVRQQDQYRIRSKGRDRIIEFRFRSQGIKIRVDADNFLDGIAGGDLGGRVVFFWFVLGEEVGQYGSKNCRTDDDPFSLHQNPQEV